MSDASHLVVLDIDAKNTTVLCHMGDFGCGDGGWTPVMKIDGNKVCLEQCLTLYILTSVFISSVLFSIHYLTCLQENLSNDKEFLWLVIISFILMTFTV